MKSELKLEDDCYCFACGKKNLRGLGLNISKINQEVFTELKIEKWMQGYKDIAHGGLISLVLDEMMVNACYLNGYKAVSAEYRVRFKKPCFVGDRVEFRAKIVEMKMNLAICKSWAKIGSNLIAEAESKCWILKED